MAVKIIKKTTIQSKVVPAKGENATLVVGTSFVDKDGWHVELNTPEVLQKKPLTEISYDGPPVMKNLDDFKALVDSMVVKSMGIPKVKPHLKSNPLEESPDAYHAIKKKKIEEKIFKAKQELYGLKCKVEVCKSMLVELEKEYQYHLLCPPGYLEEKAGAMSDFKMTAGKAKYHDMNSSSPSLDAMSNFAYFTKEAVGILAGDLTLHLNDWKKEALVCGVLPDGNVNVTDVKFSILYSTIEANPDLCLSYLKKNFGSKVKLGFKNTEITPQGMTVIDQFVEEAKKLLPGFYIRRIPSTQKVSVYPGFHEYELGHHVLEFTYEVVQDDYNECIETLKLLK